MNRLKTAALVLLMGLVCLHTGCFRQYGAQEEGSREETQPTLGTIGMSLTDSPDSSADGSTGPESSLTDSSADGETTTGATTSPSASGGTKPPSTAGTAGTTSTTASPTTTAPPPPVQAEMKGTWLSYIELDTLFKANKTASAVKSAIDRILDNCASYGLNTVFFHVRANSDAYYNSSIFKPAASVKSLIASGFDPLAYAVGAAHSRGLRLHAWVNPYRIGSNLSYRAEGVAYFSMGGKYYYVPTSLNAQKLILDGLRELTANYAIDGIQYDDYFYPAGLGAGAAAFETADYDAYRAGGGRMSVSDWRRAAVDALIQGSYGVAHQKPACVFGVSPSHDYEENYGEKFADVGKWLRQPGYIDYLCPQIYFGFLHGSAPFDKMVDEWYARPRAAGVELYAGLAMYKAGLEYDPYAKTEAGKTEWKNHNDIMKRSVEYLRAKGLGGMIFYRCDSFEMSIARGEVENLLPLLR